MKKDLLIIEDEADLRETIVEVLSPIADTIVQAENGEVAIEILKNQRFASILSDINMPKKNGFEVLEFVRNKGIITPFIFLTGYGDGQNIKKALQYQATDFIEKPYDDQHLMTTIERSLILGAGLIEKEKEYMQMINSLNIDEERKKKMIEAMNSLNILKLSNKKA